MPNPLMSLPKHKLRCAISAAALATVAAPGFAQDGIVALEEIIVQAQKHDENVQDVPIAVSLYTGDLLDELSVKQTRELVYFTPGLTATPGPNGGNEGLFYIRGIGQNDGNAATDPGVGAYLDGVYMGRTTGASFDALDIQRVEVLRGPQGTLFGRNTIGGAISVITADPYDTFGGKVKLGVVERDGFEAAFNVNTPITDDLFVRWSGLTREQDGWGESVWNDDTYGDIDTQAGRIKVLWNATDELQFKLSADSTHARGTPIPNHLIDVNLNASACVGPNPFCPPPLPPGIAFGTSPIGVPMFNALGNNAGADDIYDVYSSLEDPSNDLDILGGSLHVLWEGDDLSITSISAYRDMESLTDQDFDGGPYKFYDNSMSQNQHQWSQELQFSGWALDDNMHWLMGLYWFEENVDYVNVINLGSPPVPFAPGFESHQAFELDVESKAIFGQFAYDLNYQWKLTVGFRYNEEEKVQSYDLFFDNTAQVFNYAGLGLPPMPPIIPTLSPDNPFLTIPAQYDEKWDSFDPKVILDYRPEGQEDLLFYASYAEGFKSGGWNGRPQGDFSSPNATPVPTYEPEEVETYEIGIKSQWADNRVRFNGAYYYSDYTDIQLLVLGEAGAFFETRNAAEATIQGVEMELNALVTQAFEVQWTGTWTDTEYNELDQSAILAGIDEGDKLPLTPDFTTSLGLIYTWDMADAGSFRLRGDYVWQDDIWYGAANGRDELQKDYALVNLRATWLSVDESWTVSVYGLNITDEEYFINTQDARGNEFGGLGVSFGSPGRPLEIGAELTYTF